MRTNFYRKNSLIISGDTINKLYFYKNGAVLGYVDKVQEHAMKGETLESVYDGEAQRVNIDFDIKKAVKLNLNRSDAFYIKNPEKRYAIDRPYDLYIHADLVNFVSLGDVLAVKGTHEKHYFETYSVSFSSVEYKRMKIDKISGDKNYTLQPGEQFSEHSYGSDKNHACVWYFDNSESEYIKRMHPDKVGEKGIIKRYYESEISNGAMILTRPTYSKTEKDDYITNLERMSKKLQSLNINIYTYQLEKMLENGLQIVEV